MVEIIIAFEKYDLSTGQDSRDATGQKQLRMVFTLEMIRPDTVPMRMGFYDDSMIGFSYMNMTWGGSKRCTSPVTFSVGAELDIVVFVTQQQYTKFVNGVNCCNYSHHLSYVIPNRFILMAIMLFELSV
ncbi:hypothetical protein Btru_056095 [Bulinus truncatus]|nr:hypothetical protein Btru_056095 [Bulinus truncatus]